MTARHDDVTRHDPAAEAAALAAENATLEVALSKWRRAHTAGFGACFCATIDCADGHCLHCRTFRDGWAGEGLRPPFHPALDDSYHAGRRARRAYDRRRAQDGAS